MRKFDDIIPPSRRKEVEPMRAVSPDSPPPRPPRQSKFPYLTVITTLVVVVLSVLALFYFSSAKVEITPNTVSAAVQNTFTAYKDSGALPYKIVTAQKIASQSVKSNGTKEVNTSASGTITVYNTQSKAQSLITNTRFAATGGLVFRIHSGITIPAGTTEKPGSINVKVYADKTGDAYNIAPTSFTIPGFAGTPQATLVYARSTTSMTGGASGAVPVIDATLEKSTRNALRKALAPDLMTSIEAQVPEGFVLLPKATLISYQELSSTPSQTAGMVEVKEQGTITAVVFPNAVLAQNIAESIGGLGYQGEPLTLSSFDTLSFSATGGLPTADAKSFSFTLNGTASLIYTVDPGRIAGAVSGKTRSEAEVVLTNYPEIKRAIIILRPFWRKAFPEDPASISVTSNNE